MGLIGLLVLLALVMNSLVWLKVLMIGLMVLWDL
jgi:hypothetical protein